MRQPLFLLVFIFSFIIISCSKETSITSTDSKIEARNNSSYGQYMIKPVSGIVTQEFSASHSGIDIGASKGTPIYAAASGIIGDVKRDGQWNYGAGNYVVIQHRPGDLNPYRRICYSEEWTKYYHLTDAYVYTGQSISRGQLIGTVGNTGDATGYHLHFEIDLLSRYGSPSNPREWIRFGYSSKTGKGDIW